MFHSSDITYAKFSTLIIRTAYFNQHCVFESWLLGLQDRSASALVAEKRTHWLFWRVFVLLYSLFLVLCLLAFLSRRRLLNFGGSHY